MSRLVLTGDPVDTYQDPLPRGHGGKQDQVQLMDESSPASQGDSAMGQVGKLSAKTWLLS